MTIEEFINLDPDKIRRSNELMRLFVDFYEAAFLLKPNCAACTFKKGFRKLKRYVKEGSNIKIKAMATNKEVQTFIIKPQYRTKILTYMENGKVFRKYGHGIDNDFAKKLVEYGKSEVFAKLPELESSDKYESMDWKDEILPLYAEVKERTGEKANSRKKDDIIAFLKEHED